MKWIGATRGLLATSIPLRPDADHRHRLKTHMTLVQHQENELEQKRDHCKRSLSCSLRMAKLTDAADIKVVDAFKSALQLLGT